MPPFLRLVIPVAIQDDIVRHAQQQWPRECCGLLAGRVADGIAKVSARYPITNDADSATEYTTHPQDMLKAFRAMRTAGHELLAIYHSHPMSAPVPSPRDVAGNTYGETVVHLIVGFVNSTPQVRGWWLSTTAFRAAACDVV